MECFLQLILIKRLKFCYKDFVARWHLNFPQQPLRSDIKNLCFIMKVDTWSFHLQVFEARLLLIRYVSENYQSNGGCKWVLWREAKLHKIVSLCSFTAHFARWKTLFRKSVVEPKTTPWIKTFDVRLCREELKLF